MKALYFTIFLITIQPLPSFSTDKEDEGKIRTKRIINGIKAQSGQFPFACHISWFWPHPSRRNPNGGYPAGAKPPGSRTAADVDSQRAETFDSKFYQCSCAIIHERFIATAANCFQPAINYYNKTDMYTLEMNSTNWPLIVRAGFADALREENSMQERNGFTVYVHSSYMNKSTMMDVDLAIVKLRYIFDLNSRSQSVKVASIGKKVGPYNHYNTRCVGVGYGLFEYIPPSKTAKEPSVNDVKKLINHLRYFRVKSGNVRFCSYLQERLDFERVHYDWFYLCAISDNETVRQHNCKYDVGGPLVCQGVLMGVMAQGREIKPCGVKRKSFSMYTYLGTDEVLNWLDIFIPGFDRDRLLNVPFEEPWKKYTELP